MVAQKICAALLTFRLAHRCRSAWRSLLRKFVRSCRRKKKQARDGAPYAVLSTGGREAAATVLLENAGINVGEQNETKASSQRN